jgi:hypothetical protein
LEKEANMSSESLRDRFPEEALEVWQVSQRPCSGDNTWIEDEYGHLVALVYVEGTNGFHNPEFIANSPTDLKAALTVIEEARTLLAYIEGHAHQYHYPVPSIPLIRAIDAFEALP